MLGCYWNYSSRMSSVREKRTGQIRVIQVAIAAKELSLWKKVLSILLDSELEEIALTLKLIFIGLRVCLSL